MLEEKEIHFKDLYTGTVLLSSLTTLKKKKKVISLPLKSYIKLNEILITLKG